MCFEDNCFLTTLDTRDFEIAQFGSYTPLVIQYEYMEAYLNENTIYFHQSPEWSEPKGW